MKASYSLVTYSVQALHLHVKHGHRISHNGWADIIMSLCIFRFFVIFKVIANLIDGSIAFKMQY